MQFTSNDSLALYKIVIQVTYSESWLDSSEFSLHPSSRSIPSRCSQLSWFLVSVSHFSSECETQGAEERGFSGRWDRLELAKGWAGQAGGPWMSKSHCLASHASFSRLPQRAVGEIILYWVLLLWKCKCWNRLDEEFTAPASMPFFMCCVQPGSAFTFPCGASRQIHRYHFSA